MVFQVPVYANSVTVLYLERSDSTTLLYLPFLKRAVIDHPFSPFLNVSPQQMNELSKAGILFNFTWDELSPLLGVDPQIMYNTIRSVGPEHFTLSSDAGEPLFPDSVEALRLVRGYMEAFGLTQEELYTVAIPS